ncbi:MAG: hypothetical protein ABSF25_20355 [Bryobacteraceae bacterium]|jgi:hypothetical protein
MKRLESPLFEDQTASQKTVARGVLIQKHQKVILGLATLKRKEKSPGKALALYWKRRYAIA